MVCLLLNVLREAKGCRQQLFELQQIQMMVPSSPCDSQSDVFIFFSPSSFSSIRQYELVVHTDVNMNKVYTGEMGRLKSYENQKP